MSKEEIERIKRQIDAKLLELALTNKKPDKEPNIVKIETLSGTIEIG
jgi:hypothetical protein